MGFPDRTSRTDIGPTLENERPVTNPLKEIPAGAFNEAFWQAAGMSQVTPKAVLHCTVSGGVVTVAAQGLTWDPDGALANIVFTYINAGYYEFAFANQYPDEAGVNQSTNITGGMVQVTDLEEEYGTHDGANNSATLDDSTKAVGRQCVDKLPLLQHYRRKQESCKYEYCNSDGTRRTWWWY